MCTFRALVTCLKLGTNWNHCELLCRNFELITHALKLCFIPLRGVTHRTFLQVAIWTSECKAGVWTHIIEDHLNASVGGDKFLDAVETKQVLHVRNIGKVVFEGVDNGFISSLRRIFKCEIDGDAVMSCRVLYDKRDIWWLKETIESIRRELRNRICSQGIGESS